MQLVARSDATCETLAMSSRAATPGALHPDSAPSPRATVASGTPTQLALFRRFPKLAALPRTPLIAAPTPVEPLRIAGVPGGALFVKRDDLSSPVYGGNKARKLEFALAAAAARGARRLVTTGGIGTHHGLATAIFGRTLGIKTSVVVVPQPVNEHVRAQLRALLAFGAELLPARSVPGAALQVVRAFTAATLRGEKPSWLPTGGSSALANISFVSAAFEVAEQIEAGVLPEPAEIYLPIGSGGTFAGLVLGAKLAGLRARIVGVLVTDILPPGPVRLARLARASLALLRRHEPSLPTVEITPADFEVVRAQLGAGYGATTPAAEAAVLACRDAGLALETTYTAKCMAEVLARLADGRARTPVLFWNTYNSADFWKTAPEPVAEDRLPRAIQRWLAEASA
jgi:D-cysteine desulfhydrase